MSKVLCGWMSDRNSRFSSAGDTSMNGNLADRRGMAGVHPPALSHPSLFGVVILPTRAAWLRPGGVSNPKMIASTQVGRMTTQGRDVIKRVAFAAFVFPSDPGRRSEESSVSVGLCSPA